MIKQKPLQIFSKDADMGIDVVKSPVKLTILEMLRSNDMEFDEIVRNTGKSKSTISVHLKSLREDGIISYRLGESDSRRKIFYLNSKYLGSVEVSKKNEIEETRAEYLIENIVENDGDFTVLLFHTLRSMLIQEGINIDPVLHSTGIRMGQSLYNKLYDDDLEVFIENIKITASDCFECELLPKTGKPACYLDTGIFQALFSEFFGLPVRVIEIQCCTMGDENCVFEIEPFKRK